MKIVCTCLVAALLLVACGGSSPPRPSSVAVSQSTGGAVTTTTVASSAPPATASPGPPPCRGADLGLSYLGGQGATGHGELGFALKNTGSSTCHTFGYPGVLFLGQGGKPLPTAPSHTTQDYFGSAPKLKLTLTPGQTMSFRLGVTHGIASVVGCTTAYGLQVIAPDDTATLRVSIPGGAYECRTVTVSPLRPGTSAYP